MKNKKFLIILCAVLLVVAIGIVSKNQVLKNIRVQGQEKTIADIYYCPMHTDFISDKPGSCAICGMSLVKKEVNPQKKQATAERKILYYRNPMDPEVTSPVAMKDSMGMDYIPVYEDEAVAKGVFISQEKQQLINVKTEKVERRPLKQQIITVGKVAYDPELYVAQEEYLQSFKTVRATKKSVLASVSEQAESFLKAAEKKLILLGMSKEEIRGLEKSGIAQENLYLPQGQKNVWVYIAIYEYEIGLIKEGQDTEIEAIAFPGEIFKGKITAMNPVLDSVSRSVQVRVEVENIGNKLKPQMFVNAKINVDMGEKLAVPETAVLDTGTRKIVYIAKEGDMVEQREVNLGQKAQGYFEVLSGLNEGDVVITSGNFLVDSESKLKGNH